MHIEEAPVLTCAGTYRLRSAVVWFMRVVSDGRQEEEVKGRFRCDSSIANRSVISHFIHRLHDPVFGGTRVDSPMVEACLFAGSTMYEARLM
jgi:hypothetical protein